MFSYRNPDLSLLLVRIAVGIVFMAHGWAKLANMEGTVAFFATLGFASFLAYFVAIVEFVGGIAVLAGLLARLSSVGLAVIMLVAIFYVKAGKPFLGGYELDFTLLLAILSIIFAGVGKYSLEALLRKRKEQAVAAPQVA